MKLGELLEQLGLDGRDYAGSEISGITADSRQVAPGMLFVALAGERVDGHAYAVQAAQAGAAAVLAEDASRIGSCGVPVFEYRQLARELYKIACHFYGYPSSRLTVIGVTGTNGKTSTVFFIKNILQTAGRRAGLIGTIHNEIGDLIVPAVNTTPDALSLQKLLAEMVDAGMDSVVMEVSSHALALERVGGIEFDTAVFTNLTEDHLDFHGTMEAYVGAKLRFLDCLIKSRKPNKRVCCNSRIEFRDRVFAAIDASGLPCWTFGVDASADFSAEEITADLQRTAYRLHGPSGSAAVSLEARGYFAVYNSLAAAAAASACGTALDAIAAGLQPVQIPGRFEIVSGRDPRLVVVDYAHTDDALTNLIDAARRLNPSRILTVFGCGGDRDRRKRPLMAKAAAAGSDLLFVTSDNPRSEDPEKILDDVFAGLADSAVPARRIVDRAEAIRAALDAAQPGDVVLIAGKGHETYQIFADRTVHFDDREVARSALGAV